MDPCKQEKTLGEHGSDIRHLHDAQKFHDTEISKLFKLVRCVEQQIQKVASVPGREAQKEMSSIKLSVVVFVCTAVVNVLFKVLGA